MFNSKKKANIPSTRYCVSALELPYEHLYGGSFVVALSRLSYFREITQASASALDARALGVLHGPVIFQDRGAEEPALPVEITFNAHPWREGRLGSADLALTADGFYALYVNIHDPHGEVSQAVQQAFSHAVTSGYSYLHLRCVDLRYKSPVPASDIFKKLAEQAAFLKRVDAREAELETIEFDKLAFEDCLMTKAPRATWSWKDFEPDQPQHQSARTKRWRRDWLPHRAKRGGPVG